jgi:hypothetical protein
MVTPAALMSFCRSHQLREQLGRTPSPSRYSKRNQLSLKRGLCDYFAGTLLRSVAPFGFVGGDLTLLQRRIDTYKITPYPDNTVMESTGRLRQTAPLRGR